MTIGIDGGALSVSDERLRLGVYRVTYNLVKEMAVLDAKNNYRVYVFGRGESGRQALSAPNVRFVQLPRPGYAAVWQTTDMVRHPVDTYLGVSQSIPPLIHTLCDVRTIGFIYDVGFLTHPEYYPGSADALVRQTAALVSRSRHIITISGASKTALQTAYHVPDDRITVAHLGIEPVFSPRGAGYRHEHPYFLCVGALKRGKNIPHMLHAFAHFLKRVRHTYDLFIIGSDYWLDPEIQETIAELGLSHRVQIKGYVSDDELSSFYRGAQALVSVSAIEGFGLPVAEAMASSCPVIASTAGSYPEVVGSAGILVDPKDRLALSDAMLRMVQDVPARKAFSALGRKRAAVYTWRTFARAVLGVTRPPERLSHA